MNNKIVCVGTILLLALGAVPLATGATQDLTQEYEEAGSSESESGYPCSLPDSNDAYGDAWSRLVIWSENTWENGALHSIGYNLGWILCFDGTEHHSHTEGYISIDWVDGGNYYHQSDSYTTMTWSGQGLPRFAPIITITFPRHYDTLHIHLDRYVDGQYVRTIDKVFYGNWDSDSGSTSTQLAEDSYTVSATSSTSTTTDATGTVTVSSTSIQPSVTTQ